MTNQAITDLARRLTRLEQGVTAQNVPQLAASSVEAGAIPHYDSAGQMTALVGEQHDGTTAAAVLAGPTPPAPAGLDADAGPGSIAVTWNGSFADGSVAPMDFARVEVHVGEAQDFEPDPLPGSLTRAGTIESPGGGTLTIPATPGDRWVALLTRSQSGKASDHGEVVGVTVEPIVDSVMFDQACADIEEAKNGGVGLDRLVVTDQATINTAVVLRLWAEMFTAKKITSNEIDTTSLATAILSAQNATIGARLTISPGGELVAGDTLVAYTVLDQYGLRTIIVGDDGKPNVVTSIGQSTENVLSTRNAAGELTSSVSPDGNANFADVTTVGDIYPGGRPLLGKRFDPNADDGILDDAGRGIIDGGFGDLRPLIDASVKLPAGTTPLAVIGLTVDPGRALQVSMPFRINVSDVVSGAVARAGVVLYYTLKPIAAGDADEPSTSSTFIGDFVDSYPSAVGGVTNQVDFVWRPFGQAYNVKLLVCAYSANCQVQMSAYNPFDWQLYVTDIGRRPESSARLLDLPTSGQTSSETAPTPAPPAKKTYTATWHATDSAEYLGDGSRTPSSARLTSGHIRHGRAYGGPNNLRGVIVFNAPSVDGEKKYMSTALTGATITKAEVFVRVKMWSYSTGGTLTLRPLGDSTPPSTLSVPSTTQSKRYTGPNQGIWIQIPTSWIKPTERGIIVGPARSESATDYGYWHPHTAAVADRPKLRLTYSR